MVDANRRRLTVGRADPTKLPGGGAGAKEDSWLSRILAEKYPEVICLHSTTDGELKKKRSFAEKDKAGCDKGKVTDSPPVLAGVNVSCKKGLKPESPNQDSYIIIVNPGKWGIYGVYDGHGPNGHDVSDYAVQQLVMNFLGDDKFTTEADRCFTFAFTECQKQIEAAKQPPIGMDSSSSGSTCTMTFHNFETDILTIAHVGDSRACLYEGVDNWTVLKETEDHKPSLPAEKKRIEAAGGRVVFDGYYNYRVFAKAGMYPGLNMSRALGDVVAHKEAGLTAEPELNIVELKKHRGGRPLTLIIASDGVWEFIKSEDAPKHLLTDGKLTNSQAKCEELAKKSWDSWMEDSDNEISDDITVICISL